MHHPLRDILAWLSPCAIQSPVSEPRSETSAEGRPDLSVIVVSDNTLYLLERMFGALDDAWGNLRLQIIVVDNTYRDGSAAFLRAKYLEST